MSDVNKLGPMWVKEIVSGAQKQRDKLAANLDRLKPDGEYAAQHRMALDVLDRMLEAARRSVPAQGGTCVICGESEPRTGRCGSDDQRALCKLPAQASAAEVVLPERAKIVQALRNHCLTNMTFEEGDSYRLVDLLSTDGEPIASGYEQIEGIVDAIMAAAQVPAGEPSAVVARYTCIGKGGEYELIGTARGAGTDRFGTAVVYRDTMDGALYFRNETDFARRMEPVAAAHAPAQEPSNG